MSDVLLLSRAALVTTLDFRSCIAAIEAAFHAERRGEWNTPRRIAAHAGRGALLAMPCGSEARPALGAKLVATFPGNSERGLPSVSGLYALFDPSTGECKSIIGVQGQYHGSEYAATLYCEKTVLLEGRLEYKRQQAAKGQK